MIGVPDMEDSERGEIVDEVAGIRMEKRGL